MLEAPLGPRRDLNGHFREDDWNMLELPSDGTDRGEVGLETFDRSRKSTSGRLVVSSGVGKGGKLNVLDDGRDKTSE